MIVWHVGDALVIQGDAYLNSGSITGGNTVVCGTCTQGILFVIDYIADIIFGQRLWITSCDKFDFTGTNLFVNDFSSCYGSQSPTSSLTCTDGWCLVTGTRGLTVNVVNIPSGSFGAITSLTINSECNTFVIINVGGQINSIANLVVTLAGGIDSQHVFLNFYETTSLTASLTTLLVSPVVTVVCFQM